MNYDEVNDILATSTQDDWIIDTNTGSYTYKKDLNLRIAESNFDDDRAFDEPWATKHPDPNAKSNDFTVFYNNSFVRKERLVSVDGHRAVLPMPKSRTDLRIDKADYNFAKIVNTGSQLDEYLERSNISVIND